MIFHNAVKVMWKKFDILKFKHSENFSGMEQSIINIVGKTW